MDLIRIAVIFLLGATGSFCQEVGVWVSLFNGKDLSHWEIEAHTPDLDKQYFYVEEGAIVADGYDTDHDYVWLYSEKEYLDFHLKIKYQVDRNDFANSGIQVRSRYSDEGGNWPHAEGGWLNGPQVDIGSRGRDGGIYNEVENGPYRKWLEDIDTAEHFIWADEGSGWNEMEIHFEGLVLKVWLNGVQVMDYNGEGLWDNDFHTSRGVGSVPGHIALQIHAGNIMKLKFKDIEILDLSDIVTGD